MGICYFFKWVNIGIVAELSNAASLTQVLLIINKVLFFLVVIDVGRWRFVY